MPVISIGLVATAMLAAIAATNARSPILLVKCPTMIRGMLHFGKFQPRPHDIHSQHGFVTLVLIAETKRQADLASHVPDFSRIMVVRGFG
jgi:hypothetical protein